MENKKIIEKIIKKYEKEIIDLREYLHENPELDLDLFNTSKTIKEKLNKLNIEYREMRKTGICAVIRGAKKGKTVLLRGDMDALPITEKADVPYKSKIDGVMHACGHDGHVAGLFGALLVINDLKEDLEGNVVFLFQPGEEKSGGAEEMIKEGALENPKVDMSFGLHLWGSVPKNHVSSRAGVMMASPDEFEITIVGQGGHASEPEKTIDPIPIAAQVILGIQTISSRMISTQKPIVISISSISSDSKTNNIISNEVKMLGTFRVFDVNLRKEIPKMIEKIVLGITSSYGAKYKIKFDFYYPPLKNNKKANDIIVNSAKKLFGEKNYIEMEELLMGGEDFAYFNYHVPSAFILLGIAEENEKMPIHHHPEFQFRSEICIDASKLLALTALDALNYLNEK